MTLNNIIIIPHQFFSVKPFFNFSCLILLILSNNSNTSPHVLREVERAVSKNIPIIVYRIEDVILTKSMEYFLMTHQWVNGKTEGYQYIVDAIRNLGNSIRVNADNRQKKKNQKTA